MSNAVPFPWRRLMETGLGQLRLCPRAFWSMTPRELMAAMAGAGLLAGAINAPGRAELDALMQCYPDTKDTSDASSD